MYLLRRYGFFPPPPVGAGGTVRRTRVPSCNSHNCGRNRKQIPKLPYIGYPTRRKGFLLTLPTYRVQTSRVQLCLTMSAYNNSARVVIKKDRMFFRFIYSIQVGYPYLYFYHEIPMREWAQGRVPT